MFEWYRSSKICYAYLWDVPKDDFNAKFPISRWFHRGWTLQELLAPDNIELYDLDWKLLGTKDELAD
jgi:hypothetical protein